MSSSIKHSGKMPEYIFLVFNNDTEEFWVYLKHGHAINRVLKEKKVSQNVNIVTYEVARQIEQRLHEV